MKKKNRIKRTAFIMLGATAIISGCYAIAKWLAHSFAQFGGNLFVAVVAISISSVFFLYSALTPPPPKPVIRYAKFHYELKYEIDGAEKVYKNTMVCKFKGIKYVDQPFGFDKVKTWTRTYKKDSAFEELGQYSMYCYPKKTTEYYMGDSEYINKNDNGVYVEVRENDRQLSKEEKEEFFNEHNFKIISQHCDPPIKNKFTYFQLEPWHLLVLLF